MNINIQELDEEIIARAEQYAADFQAQQTSYKAMAAEYQAQGDRPPICFHGVNLWTSHDPICWQCENAQLGDHSEYPQVLEWALAEAKIRVESERRRHAQTMAARENLNAQLRNHPDVISEENRAKLIDQIFPL